MDPENACPRCGSARLANAPAGLCPRCLLENALRAGRIGMPGDPVADPGATDEGPACLGVAPSVVHRSRPSGILSTLDETVGPVPRVLLRDAAADGARPA